MPGISLSLNGWIQNKKDGSSFVAGATRGLWYAGPGVETPGYDLVVAPRLK